LAEERNFTGKRVFDIWYSN